MGTVQHPMTVDNLLKSHMKICHIQFIFKYLFHIISFNSHFSTSLYWSTYQAHFVCTNLKIDITTYKINCIVGGWYGCASSEGSHTLRSEPLHLRQGTYSDGDGDIPLQRTLDERPWHLVPYPR